MSAAQKDAVLQASIDFIASLTGMKPPPIEIAPAETFRPFKEFADKVCAIFASPQPTEIALEALIRARARKIGFDELDQTIAALEAEIAQVEPVDCQFQGSDGRWHSFINDQHKADTIASGRFQIRELFTTPQAVNAELLVELENCAEVLSTCFPDAPVDSCIGVAIANARAAIQKAEGAKP